VLRKKEPTGGRSGVEEEGADRWKLRLNLKIYNLIVTDTLSRFTTAPSERELFECKPHQNLPKSSSLRKKEPTGGRRC
jgi:hypothetical protein